MEKNEQKTVKTVRKSKLDVYAAFVVLPVFICSHFAWMAAVIIGNEWLNRITLSNLLVWLGLGVLYLGYTFWRGDWRLGRQHMDATLNEHSVIGAYSRLLTPLYIGTLTICVILAYILPESLGWVIALVVLLAIVLFIAVTIHYYRLYREDRTAQLDSRLDVKVWEKYWAYLMVSNSMHIWLALAIAVYLLAQGLTPVLSDTLFTMFSQLNAFVWIMLPLVIVYELSKLSQHHEVVISSQPGRNFTMLTTLGAEGLVAVFLVPLVKRCIYNTCALYVADTVFLVVCMVTALSVMVMAIYFWAYKSKYLKASTLSW